jgi:hypothetical protein
VTFSVGASFVGEYSACTSRVISISRATSIVDDDDDESTGATGTSCSNSALE